MSIFRISSSSFLLTKHSWKGKYRRVLTGEILNKFLENFCQILLIKISNFTVSEDVFSTYNPSSMEVTNSWKLSDVVGMTPTNSTVRKLKKIYVKSIFLGISAPRFYVKSISAASTLTVWKIVNFSATQIFREINFRDFRGLKTAILKD